MNAELSERIENDFSYHSPYDHSIDAMRIIRNDARELAHTINDLVPDGREKSLALTALETVSMWANAGIARHQSEEDPF